MKACLPSMVLMTLLVGRVTPVEADPIRDQFFLVTESGSVSGSNPMAQTFTAGIAGMLSGISIPLFGEAPVVVEVRRTTHDGFPTRGNGGRSILGETVVVPSSSQFEFANGNFSAFRIALRPGDVLAIALRSTGILNWQIALDDAATYDRGEAFLRESGPEWRRFPDVFSGSFSRGDFLFETFVDTEAAPTPEPETTVLLGTALAVIAAVRWRRRHSYP